MRTFTEKRCFNLKAIRTSLKHYLETLEEKDCMKSEDLMVAYAIDHIEKAINALEFIKEVNNGV